MKLNWMEYVYLRFQLNCYLRSKISQILAEFAKVYDSKNSALAHLRKFMLTKFFQIFQSTFSLFFSSVSTQKFEGKFTTQEQGHINGISGKVILEGRK